MQLSEIRRVLLALTGLRREFDFARLGAFTLSDWDALRSIAEIHRLQPILHWLHKDEGRIPEGVREDWRAAYRQSAMTALVQRAELEECFDLLVSAGFEPVALKGSYLVAYAYPQAALRPMRDIDIILPAHEVIPAYEILRGAGYTMADSYGLPLEDVMRIDKHLPIIRAPRGTMVELHKRLSQPPGALDLDAPDVDEAVLMDRAIERDGISFPVPEDLLAHLIVHAIYGHRLDCGPLVLTDIEFLTRAETFDWEAFWQRARQQGWDSGGKLLFDLVREYHGGLGIPRLDLEPEPTPAEIRQSVPDLMLQRLDTRRSAKAWGAISGGNYAALLRRMFGRAGGGPHESVTRDESQGRGRLRWAVGEAKLAAIDFLSCDVRSQSRNLAQFRKWLRD